MTPTEILIHNERTKLLANALDPASLAVGVLGPIVALLDISGSGPVSPSLPTLAISTILWLTMAVWLHVVARYVLGKLK